MAFKKRGIKKVASITKEDMENLAAEYERISEQVKQLSNRKSELASKIKEGAVKLGTINDKGSHYLDTGNYVCGNIRKVSIKPNIDKGYDFLMHYKCKDGSNLKKCIKQVITYIVDEEELGSAVQEGKIDMETVRENVYDVSESFSVSVEHKKVEEMPEIVQTTVKKAARKK